MRFHRFTQASLSNDIRGESLRIQFPDFANDRFIFYKLLMTDLGLIQTIKFEQKVIYHINDNFSRICVVKIKYRLLNEDSRITHLAP